MLLHSFSSESDLGAPVPGMTFERRPAVGWRILRGRGSCRRVSVGGALACVRVRFGAGCVGVRACMCGPLGRPRPRLRRTSSLLVGCAHGGRCGRSCRLRAVLEWFRCETVGRLGAQSAGLAAVRRLQRRAALITRMADGVAPRECGRCVARLRRFCCFGLRPNSAPLRRFLHRRYR